MKSSIPVLMYSVSAALQL